MLVVRADILETESVSRAQTGARQLNKMLEQRSMEGNEWFAGFGFGY